MSDTTFRSKIEDTPAVEESVKVSNVTTGGVVNIDVPYTDYEKQKGHPYTVDYFGLGDTWNDPSGGFPEEISLLEEFISGKIQSGEYPNTSDAVNSRLKALEKLTRLEKDERTVIKVETLAAYARFLMDVDKIKYNLRRYDHN